MNKTNLLSLMTAFFLAALPAAESAVLTGTAMDGGTSPLSGDAIMAIAGSSSFLYVDLGSWVNMNTPSYYASTLNGLNLQADINSWFGAAAGGSTNLTFGILAANNSQKIFTSVGSLTGVTTQGSDQLTGDYNNILGANLVNNLYNNYQYYNLNAGGGAPLATYPTANYGLLQNGLHTVFGWGDTTTLGGNGANLLTSLTTPYNLSLMTNDGSTINLYEVTGGVAGGTALASFSLGTNGILSASATPVPEPSTYGLMIVSFIGGSIIFYRRSRKV